MRSARIRAALALGEPAAAYAGAGAEPSGWHIHSDRDAAGRTARETVVIGGPIMPDEFDESDASEFEE
ncbi:MAG TPA: hypothetical protein PKM31_05845 [Bacillota bacterium]|jgi:hypothetical protein|nr:hypothetical protein [Bacillota bacterium]